MKGKFTLSILLLILSLVTTVRGQYMCTDINPDSVVSIPTGATLQLTYDIDINNDATMDFRFQSVQSGNFGFVLIQATQIGTNNAVLADGANNALALTAGAPIAPGSTVWVQMNGSNQNMMQMLGGPPTGSFAGMGDRFLGLRFLVGPSTYYGWIRFEFSGSVNSYTVKDYGYNSVANASITAGQVCNVVFSPSFSLSTPVCAGASQTVTANTGTFVASGYTWTAAPPGPVIASPNTSVTGINFPTAGTFSITLSATSGTTTASDTKTIVVNPGPTFSFVSTSALLCAGQTATITASGANTYSWNTGAATSTISVSPNVTTVYTVTGTNSFSCSGAATFTQNVTVCSGLVEPEGNHQAFAMYPNPAHGGFKIFGEAEATIFVTDQLGKIVKEIRLNEANNYALIVNGLAPGVYFVTDKKLTMSLVLLE